MATRHADRRERPMSFAPHAPIQRPRQKARQGGALVPCEPKFLGTEFSLGDAEAVPVVRQYFADARPAVLKTEAGCRRLEPVALGRRGQRSARRVPRPDPVGELRDPVGELRDAVDVVAPLRREATSPATRRGGRARGDESCRSRTTRKQEPPGGIAIDAEVEQPRPVRPAPDRADRQADAPQVRAGGIGEIARGHGLLGEQPGHRLEQLALRYLIADPPGVPTRDRRGESTRDRLGGSRWASAVRNAQTAVLTLGPAAMVVPFPCSVRRWERERPNDHRSG